MSGRTIEDFLEDASAFDALSEEDKALLVSGGSLQGETEANDPDKDLTAEENSEAPAAVDPVSQEVIPPAETEPVVLAKDGKHVIPFSELEEARERNKQLEQELLALKSKPEDQQPDTTKETAQTVESNEQKLARLRDEWRDALFATDTELAAKLEKEADALNRQIAKDEMRADNAAMEAERKAQEAQDSAVTDAVARANALVEQYPFLKPGVPETNQDAIDLVVAQRDKLMAGGIPFKDAIEQAVAKVAPLFVKGNATKQMDSADVARKAAEAISKAKTVVPTSLSQVPAGASVHHDEGEALRSDSGLSLINRFLGKSPEEIEKMVNRAI